MWVSVSAERGVSSIAHIRAQKHHFNFVEASNDSTRKQRKKSKALGLNHAMPQKMIDRSLQDYTGIICHNNTQNQENLSRPQFDIESIICYY